MLKLHKCLKSGPKEGVLIFQLHLVIEKKFFHHSSPANNPANSYYVHQKIFTSNINDFQIRYPVCQMCIVLISAYSYPPTTNRDSLIRDDLDFIFPPTLLIEIGTFPSSECHFGISLLFSLYLRHGFRSESE